MPPIYLFYILVTALSVSIILVPYVGRLAVTVGGLDQPDERKVHALAVPRLGGVAIFSSLIFTLLFYCPVSRQLQGFLAGAIIIFLTGLVDDIANLTPSQKFAGEFVAAGVAVVFGGIMVPDLGNPFGVGVIELGPLSAPFTVVGIVGLINAVNLIDGLDGLAAGICTIASLPLGLLAALSHNDTLLALIVALLGALLGFLRYNTYPAIIFMGDSGSLLLGYCMGVFSVLLTCGGSEPVSPFIPLMVLGVPILDTLVVMLNRWRAGRPLFSADKTHLHHRLLDLGIGHKYTVLVVFGISYLLSVLAVTSRRQSDAVHLVLLLTVAGLLYGSLRLAAGSGLVADLSSNSSLRSALKARYLVRAGWVLSGAIEYLLMATMLAPAFLSEHDVLRFSGTVLFGLLLMACGVYLSRRSWRGGVCRVLVYSLGVAIAFIVENYGREETLWGFRLLQLDHLLVLLVFVCAQAKILVRKRVSLLMASPFEYLILLMTLSVPLLPEPFTRRYHLLAVAASSIVFFVAFKLVLRRQESQASPLLLCAIVSALVLALRYLVGA